MLNYEKVMSMHDHLNYKEVSYLPEKLDGLAYGDTIFLNVKLNSYEKNAILGEEIGHIYTNSSDITDYTDINKYKIEVKGRRYGYEITIPLDSLIECYEMKFSKIHEVTEHLELPESYILDALCHYRTKYNNCVDYNGYRITFDPLYIERID